MKNWKEIGIALVLSVVLTTLFTVTVMVFHGRQFSGLPAVQPRPEQVVVKQKNDERIELSKDRSDRHGLSELDILDLTTGANTADHNTEIFFDPITREPYYIGNSGKKIGSGGKVLD